MANRVVATLALILLMEASLSVSAPTGHRSSISLIFGADCRTGFRSCLHPKTEDNYIYSRKMLMDMLKKRSLEEVLQGGLHGSHGSMEVIQGVNQLRKVPSGPDPMHHNGASPKKPKTTP
ncbi:hypothetical protein Dimus_009325 [Dionaea muscipula]